MNQPQSLNLELLIKLLKMTTSPNDGEALMAARKANEQLAKVAGDWETLLRGKVTLIADPFSGSASPPPPDTQSRSAPPPPSRPAPAAPPRQPSSYYNAPPRQPAQPQAQAAPAQSAQSSYYRARSHPTVQAWTKRKTMGKKLPQPKASDLA